MKKAMLILALVLTVACPAVFAQTWDSGLPAVLDKMAEKHWQPSLQTAFGTFTYAYSDLPSPFARWVEEELAMKMPDCSRVRLFNRAAAAAMDPAFSKIYGPVFDMAGGAALLHGNYFDDGEWVRVRLQLTGLDDGVLVGSAELRIPKSALPRGLVIDPEAKVVQQASSLSMVLPAAKPAGLKVSVSTERGANAVYRDGEMMVILVTVNKDAYAKVYHIDADGKIQLIWPNRFGGSGRLAAGELVRIPGDGDPFMFRMKQPYGTEFIKVVASTRPFARNESDFVELGSDAPKVFKRGLELEEVPLAAGLASPPAAPEMAEALASYLIIEGLSR